MMIQIRKWSGIVLFLLGILGCNADSHLDYDTVFKQNSEMFEQYKPNLNYVLTDIENNSIKKWDKQKTLDIEIDNLSKQSQQYIKDLGINSIGAIANPDESCKNNYLIIMSVIKGWNIETLKSVQLRYAPCDKRTEKGYHSYDGNHVDSWGQGDNWYIISDTDWL